MTTGRQLIQGSLREPMERIGWTPRAAGWFTRSLGGAFTGVVAVSAAVEHAAAGAAEATLHVHLRHELVEPVVAVLCAPTAPDGGYRSVTATTSIGALLPGAHWRTWRVGAGSDTAAAAAEMASAVRHHAEPHLEGLVADGQLLRAAVRASPAMASAAGPCRLAVLAALEGRLDEAEQVLDATVAEATGRTDPAAELLRRMADRFRERFGS